MGGKQTTCLIRCLLYAININGLRLYVTPGHVTYRRIPVAYKNMTSYPVTAFLTADVSLQGGCQQMLRHTPATVNQHYAKDLSCLTE
jgi:hypothetical protein